ncbi:MAG: SycD/LcrH family type III secretion system chaperone [Pseudomonadota bacterium]
MTALEQMTESDFRAAIARAGFQIPGLSEAEIADRMVALAKGELTLKDARGLSDEAMEGLYAIAYNAFEAGNYDNAQKVLSFLCIFDPSVSKYWLSLGAARFRVEDYPSARDAYAMAFALERTDPRAPLRIADCHIATKDFESARHAAEAAVQLAGDTPKFAAQRRRAEGMIAMLDRRAARVSEAVG